ncbi:inorganic phosphate transporter Pho88 [Protomyces lactucae-debilis]|uniref:Inorganic phosphate transporter Pho88 n=1 Tax=Protomyces lactucae-debilis TaxID=2754530 RepID=A0A1Y2ES18_PROLT|nr:inorganic phosphate transporter Pho88 [Protomyces lactucae-debilis]ORY74339.1 inorganic phosphate transporter Pho88 [Protomyces lactucae-debilis]
MVNPQITNLAVTLGVMQIARKLDFEDPTILKSVRALYIVSNILIAIIFLVQYMNIQKRNDMTTLKYVEPASPLSGKSEPELMTTTVKEYDMIQWQSALKSSLMGLAMMSVMHGWFKFTQPLLVQSILPVKNALETKLAMIHLFGKPATGEYKRPFKAAASMFGGAAAEAATDKKSVEAAERATVKKEE